MNLKKLAGIGDDFTKFLQQICKKYKLQMSTPIIEMNGDDKGFSHITIAVQFYPEKSMEIDIKDLVPKTK